MKLRSKIFARVKICEFWKGNNLLDDTFNGIYVGF
jgi:hypothetical protein